MIFIAGGHYDILDSNQKRIAWGRRVVYRAQRPFVGHYKWLALRYNAPSYGINLFTLRISHNVYNIILYLYESYSTCSCAFLRFNAIFDDGYRILIEASKYSMIIIIFF